MKSVKFKLLIFCVVLGLFGAGRAVAVQYQYARLLVNEDAQVNQSQPTKNYGSDPNLLVGDVVGGWHDIGLYHSYLKFDVGSALPAGAVVVNAELLLMLHETYPGLQQRTIEACYVLDDSWTEGSINWGNKPSVSPVTTGTVTSNFNNPNSYYCWNVTPDVITAMGDNGVYSTAMIIKGEPTSFWNNFYSKEWTPMPDKRPYLQITYKLPGQVITSGSEGYNPEGAVITFGTPGLPTIPADFFGPGSDPFDGIIALRGSGGGGGGGRTVVERTEGVYIPDSSPSGTVNTEMVSLNLRSVEPILVTFGGGPDSFFDVYVSLELPSPGDMLISTTGGGGSGGGAYSYQDRFLQQLRFEFVDVSDPMNKKELLVPGGPGYSDMVLMAPSNEAAWQTQPTKEAEVLGYDGFYASEEQILHSELMYAGAPTGLLDLSTLQTIPPEFCITTEEQWNEALGTERVRAATVEELEEFRAQYNANREPDAEPYPESAEFREAKLYVCGPESCGGEGYPCDERDAGLVMYWGEAEPDGEYAAAWVYTPPLDPDLSNCTLTTTVYPPCGMLVVSIGLQDINGNIRGWFWNVAPAGAVPPYPPGTIPCSPSPGPGPGAVPTNITIDLSQTGVNAATPTAASYSSAAAFDITKVTDYKFDEDNNWIASTPTQPPGSGLYASWNYWKNIVVAKKTPPPPAENRTKFYIKWSQPPILVDPNADPKLIRGWDERSNYYWRPVVADDWLCKDDRAITDIHWWGSFLGWNQPYLPPIAPKAFHIGIWVDMPVGADPNADFSHPWMLIWENYCDNWAWEFYGYDLDPRSGEPDPCAPFEPEETCFQFEQFLSEDEWFYQEPNQSSPWDNDPNTSVYWLSISAIYDPNITYIPHPWGWKTRQPYWNDDAVRMWELADLGMVDWPPGYAPLSVWPPTLGALWGQGEPIWWPNPTDSWDMCFELTTKEPAYEDEPIPGDLNADKIVNFKDVAILANNWLVSSP